MIQNFSALGPGYAKAKPVKIFPHLVAATLAKLYYVVSTGREITILEDAGGGWWQERFRIQSASGGRQIASQTVGHFARDWSPSRRSSLYQLGECLTQGGTPDIEVVRQAIVELHDIGTEDSLALVREISKMFPAAELSEPYLIEVLVNRGGKEVWEAVIPDHLQTPYEYPNRLDAETAADRLYPLSNRVRVVPKSKSSSVRTSRRSGIQF